MILPILLGSRLAPATFGRLCLVPVFFFFLTCTSGRPGAWDTREPLHWCPQIRSQEVVLLGSCGWFHDFELSSGV
jgi:hypothetical protein